jgi:hypothetical protein
MNRGGLGAYMRLYNWPHPLNQFLVGSFDKAEESPTSGLAPLLFQLARLCCGPTPKMGVAVAGMEPHEILSQSTGRTN